MKTLHISRTLDLPLDIVTMAIAILAQRGAGKSYLASCLAEEMLEAGQQIVVVDPTGAWWGLKSSADGNRPGFPVVVFGGDHADVPLASTAGELIAAVLVEKKFSAILDLTNFSNAESHRFMTDFLEMLYQKSREAIHLFIDEADAFAPQRPLPGEQRMLGAMEAIVRRGRKRGIGCTMITQRPAVINKNVLTQAELLIAMRLSHPKDIAPISEWAGVHGDMETLKKMTAALPALETGTAWFWSPQALKIFECVKVRARRTFDSGATPKPGERMITPKAAAKLDLAKLGREIAQAVVDAKENDPAELKAKVRKLEAQIKTAGGHADLDSIKRAHKKGYENSERRHARVMASIRRFAENLNTSVAAHLKHINAALDSVQMGTEEEALTMPFVNAPARSPSASAPTKTPASPDQPKSGMRRMMIATAQRPGLSARQVGVRAGMSSSSGTFDTYLSKMRSNGWLDGGRDGMRLTDAGLAALGTYEPLPEGPALLAYWLGQLGGGAGRMLQALADAHPRTLTREGLAQAAGMSLSGTFDTYLSKMRTLELVSGRGELKASDELF